MSLITVLDAYDSVFTLVFSGIVSLSTIVYALLTWKLVSETRRMRKVQTEPNVSVFIKPREEWIGFVDLIIQNIGLGPAYNIKFDIKPSFESIGEDSISEIGFIKNGLNYLGPNQKIQFFLTSMTENYDDKIEKSFDINIAYDNAMGNKCKSVSRIDFSELKGLHQLGKPPLYQLVKAVEEIKSDIHRMSTGLNKLKVINYTEDEIRLKEKEFIERAKTRSQKE